MNERYALAVTINESRFFQQCGVTAFGIGVAKQEVAIAMHEIHGSAAVRECRKRLGHAGIQCTVVIVAYPDFKDITKHIQRFGAFCPVFQEVQKGMSND